MRLAAVNLASFVSGLLHYNKTFSVIITLIYSPRNLRYNLFCYHYVPVLNVEHLADKLPSHSPLFPLFLSRHYPFNDWSMLVTTNLPDLWFWRLFSPGRCTTSHTTTILVVKILLLLGVSYYLASPENKR